MLAAAVKQAAFLLGNGYLAQAEQDGLFSPPILFSSVYRPYPIPSAQDRGCKKQSLIVCLSPSLLARFSIVIFIMLPPVTPLKDVGVIMGEQIAK